MSICTITDAAKEQINTICKDRGCYAVSLNVKSGGCAGFEYKWNTMMQDEISKDDEVVSAGSGNLVIGARSVLFLVGTEIDYVRSVMAAQFEINNPNTKSSCGCGESINFNTNAIPQFIG